MGTNEVYVNITGIQKEDSFVKDKVDKEIAVHLKKISHLVRPQRLNLVIDRYHEAGQKPKYSVKAHMIGDKSVVSSSHGWDLIRAVKDSLIKIERQLEHSVKKKS